MAGIVGESVGQPESVDTGCRELTRQAAAYGASLVFAVAFLVGTGTGASLLTALLRACAAGVAAWIGGRLLLRPILSTVLDAMARDRAKAENAENAP